MRNNFFSQLFITSTNVLRWRALVLTLAKITPCMWFSTAVQLLKLRADDSQDSSSRPSVFRPPLFPFLLLVFLCVCVCVLSCVNWNTNSLHTHTQRNPPLPIHYHRFYSLAGRRYINASVISPCLNIFHFLFTTSKLSSQNCLRTLVVICAPLSLSL